MSAEVIHVRNSERGTLDRCPQQWWWSWREGLRPKETAKPLWFGTGIHLALAHYYRPGKKRGKDMIDVWRDYAKEEAEYMRVEVGGIDEDAWVEARDLGEAMLTGYMREYDGDRNWHVIAPEQTFEVRIPYPLDQLNPVVQSWIQERFGDYFILNGTFDGVYKDLDDKRLKLMEHKTAASISTGHLPMDNQAGTYWAVAYTVGVSQGWLKKSEHIKQITYNFLRKQMPDTRPTDAQGYRTNKPTKAHFIEALSDVTELTGKETLPVLGDLAASLGIAVVGDRSKAQPAPLFERHPVTRIARERLTQIERMQHEVVRMLMYREGWLDVTKSPRRDNCGFCSYREMCELHERRSDWEEFRDSLYFVQDPYADHRKSASS
jgi:hypothetical protein